MSLNESIVEEAALEQFFLRQGYGGQVGDQCRVAPTLIPAFSQREKEEDGEAIRRLNPVISSSTLATLRDTLLPKLLSGELRVPLAERTVVRCK